MKTKWYLMLWGCLAMTSSFAQTKLIAHKSHSGNLKNFKLAFKTNKFNPKYANFGVAPQPQVKNAQLDSIVFLSKNVAIMYTSEYCKWRKTDKSSRLWRAGKDTLRNHALFNQKNSVKHIRKVLKTQYHFQNPVKSIKFIDRTPHIQEKQKEEKPEETPKKHNQVLPVHITQPPGASDPFLWTMIAIVAGISLLVGGIAWNLRKSGLLNRKSTI